MKKGKMIVSILALLIAVGSAYAFKASKKTPGSDLYYFDSNNNCVLAPCEQTQNTTNQCDLTVYTDPGCSSGYSTTAWVTDGGK